MIEILHGYTQIFGYIAFGFAVVCLALLIKLALEKES